MYTLSVAVYDEHQTASDVVSSADTGDCQPFRL